MMPDEITQFSAQQSGRLQSEMMPHPTPYTIQNAR